MNGPVIFLAKGEKVHPRIIGNNLVTICGFTEGSCLITNKAAYMDDENWTKVVRVVTPGIRKMKVSNIALVLPILFYIYLTLCICTSTFSAYDL